MRCVWIVAVGLVIAAVAFSVAFEGGSQTGQSPEVRADGGPAQRVLFRVQGLSCGSCEARIRDALGKRPGVKAVGVDLAAATVTVEYVEGEADPKTLADTVTRLGYPARYLASGRAVPPPANPGARPRGGCGGGCCSGG